jgi:hypothetical protein
MNTSLILSIYLFLVPAFLYPAVIQNHLLIVEMDEHSGGISIAAVCTPPASRDRTVPLLFSDRPPSSYALVRAGESLLSYGGSGEKISAPPKAEGKGMAAVWRTEFPGTKGFLKVTLDVRFTGRRTTGVEDGVLIRYLLENFTGDAMETGLSLVLDTTLGEKQDAHFYVPNGTPGEESAGEGLEQPGGGSAPWREITRETALAGRSIPDFWLSMDSASESPVCLRGVLREQAVSVPDELLFVNYRFFRENPYPPRVRAGKGFNYGLYSRNDSAVVLQFDPERLGPGEKKEYRTILGLCGDGIYERFGDTEAPPEGPRVPAPAPVTAAGQTDGPETLTSAKDTIEKIDRIIEELNRHLKKEGRSATDEEIKTLREELETLEKEERGKP